jgi:hypothetical protein
MSSAATSRIAVDLQSETILDLKMSIQAEHGIPVEQQQLLFSHNEGPRQEKMVRNHKLDNGTFLRDYKIQVDLFRALLFSSVLDHLAMNSYHFRLAPL